MGDLAIRIVYVQSAEAEEPFAWYQGEVLSAKQYAKRAQIHQELNDIVRAATLDRDTQWGRTVRSHGRVLVEVRLSSLTGTEAVGADNLCHQVVFVDDATGAVAPSDPEVVQVGDVIW